MNEKLRKMIEDAKKKCQLYCSDEAEGEITLYAADCGGYDTTGELQLQVRNDSIRLVRCSHIDRETNKWVETDAVELVIK